MVTQILCLFLWLILIPLGMGLIVKKIIAEENRNIPALWIYGLVFFFAVFQSVTIINLMTVNDFSIVCRYVAVITAVVAVAGIFFEVRGLFYSRHKSVSNVNLGKPDKETIILWAFFGIIILFQIVQTLRLAYADGDDAYYIATSTNYTTVDKMYMQVAYTGETSELDTRYCLAPFPLWISFLARMSSIPAAVLAHSIVPCVLIIATYFIFTMIGNRLLKNRKELPIFLILLGMIQIWGNYSIYTAETFLLTRARQGKEALACMVIPLTLYLILCIGEKQKDEKYRAQGMILMLILNGIFASFCSTLGNMIFPILLGVMILVLMISNRKWKYGLYMISCIPNLIMLLLYLKIS